MSYVETSVVSPIIVRISDIVCLLIGVNRSVSHSVGRVKGRCEYIWGKMRICVRADDLLGTGPTGQTSGRTKIEFWNEIGKSTFRYL